MANADEQNAWIERVLGARLDERGNPTGFERAYRVLHVTVDLDVAALRRNNAQASEPISRCLAQAEAQAASAAWQEALGTLHLATELLAQASGRARAEDAAMAVAPGTVPSLVVAFEQAARMWDHATYAATAGSAGFRRQLEQLYPAEADAFGRILESYAGDLRQSIATARSGGVATDAGSMVMDTIWRLRLEMSSDALLAHLDRNGVAARATFEGAMDEIADVIKS